MKTFKDVYVFPLSVDNIGWVRDSKGQFVFQFEDYVQSMLVRSQIVGIINGDSKPTKINNFIHDDGMISKDGIDYILIRGWGNLTGTGGHNLPAEEAANIQDTFAEYIISKLNQK